MTVFTRATKDTREACHRMSGSGNFCIRNSASGKRVFRVSSSEHSTSGCTTANRRAFNGTICNRCTYFCTCFLNRPNITGQSTCIRTTIDCNIFERNIRESCAPSRTANGTHFLRSRTGAGGAGVYGQILDGTAFANTGKQTNT